MGWVGYVQQCSAVSSKRTIDSGDKMRSYASNDCLISTCAAKDQSCASSSFDGDPSALLGNESVANR